MRTSVAWKIKDQPRFKLMGQNIHCSLWCLQLWVQKQSGPYVRLCVWSIRVNPSPFSWCIYANNLLTYINLPVFKIFYFKQLPKSKVKLNNCTKIWPKDHSSGALHSVKNTENLIIDVENPYSEWIVWLEASGNKSDIFTVMLDKWPDLPSFFIRFEWV